MDIRKTNKQITVKLSKIENALKKKLQAFYNSSIKDNPEPIELLKRRYESFVKNLIRKTIQDAYLTGTDIVTTEISTINADFVPFISVSDVQNIANLTEKTSIQFWKTAARLHNREQAFILTPDQQLQLKTAFDVEASLIGFSILSTYLPFNTAVISKLQGITPTEGIQEGQVMFLTREDALVDPEICEPLNRTIYGANDPDIPIPIQDTHLHCRCRLVPLINGVEVTPEGFDEFYIEAF